MSSKPKSFVRTLALAALVANLAFGVIAVQNVKEGDALRTAMATKVKEVAALKGLAEQQAQAPAMVGSALPKLSDLAAKGLASISGQRLPFEMQLDSVVPTTTAVEGSSAVKLTFEVKGKYQAYDLFWKYFDALETEGLSVTALKVSGQGFEAQFSAYAQP